MTIVAQTNGSYLRILFIQNKCKFDNREEKFFSKQESVTYVHIEHHSTMTSEKKTFGIYFSVSGVSMKFDFWLESTRCVIYEFSNKLKVIYLNDDCVMRWWNWIYLSLRITCYIYKYKQNIREWKVVILWALILFQIFLFCLCLSYRRSAQKPQTFVMWIV